jgi:hypothetical protein
LPVSFIISSAKCANEDKADSVVTFSEDGNGEIMHTDLENKAGSALSEQDGEAPKDE